MTFIFRELERRLVKLFPKLDSTRRNLVNGLAEFGLHGEDATRFSLVGLFPLVIVDAGSLDEELLDGITGVYFLRNHSPRAEEDTIEWHRLHTVLKRPLSGNVGPNTLAITKARVVTREMLGWDRMGPYVARIGGSLHMNGGCQHDCQSIAR